MAGSYIYILTATICYLGGFVVFMTLVLGSAGNILMTIANMILGLKKPLNSGFPLTRNWRNTAASVSRRGNVASKSTNNQESIKLVSLSYMLAMILFSTSNYAQETSLSSRIESATKSLQTLDEQAKSCLDKLEQPASNQTITSCNLFLQSIDGALLADYLSNCELLKSWRDEYVSGEFNPQENSQANLALMRGIEYACGEGALQKRTEFVASTFNLLQGTPARTQMTNTTTRRIAELEFEKAANKERRLIQNRMLEQQQRTNLQIERQWNRQQNELIRQEIYRPSLPSN